MPLTTARDQWARAVADALSDVTARWEQTIDPAELRRALLEILRVLG